MKGTIFTLMALFLLAYGIKKDDLIIILPCSLMILWVLIEKIAESHKEFIKNQDRAKDWLNNTTTKVK
jgi:hypothetical protein